MPSKQFNELKERVEELGSHMLPAIKPDLTYTRAEYDRVRAYILLVHTEVEAFLEQRVRDEALCRVQKWKSNGTPSNILMGILAFREGPWSSPIESLDAPGEGNIGRKSWPERDVSTRVDVCHKQLVALLARNHGVKAKDVLPMLLRLGLTVTTIDREMVSDLEALGTDRGAFAHNAVRAVTEQPDPKLAKDRVNKIIDKMKVLDQVINELE